jgi:hypothetical protein
MREPVNLARFYSVMGSRPDEPGALALMAEILCQSATDEQISLSMTRCTRECRYPVRLPDLLQRIPGHEVSGPEAEARRAWDELLQFVRMYVSNDVYGNYGPEHGWYPSAYPKLSDRLLDTVRRTGGWKVYARIDEDNFPFIQKRFFEEYGAWAAVERLSASEFLASAPRMRLASKSINQPVEAVHPNNSPVVKARPIPKPMTDAERKERRELLRQQAEKLKKPT